MRKMTKQEMTDLVQEHNLATLCTVDEDGSPYAVEFNYFLLGGDVCGLLKPRGNTARNIAGNARVCVKICRTDDACRAYRAVSCFGTGAFVQDPEMVLRGWDLLEERLKLPKGTYAPFKEKFERKRNKYPLFRMRIERMTGVTSLKKGETGSGASGGKRS
jgi:nitroimidazol reductase NimA-like FMN-containing flavoprotein (pyridoxamine 5'-phosphate oxidase superfamily)